jgi:ribosomal-protein-serine acetyltransferase
VSHLAYFIAPDAFRSPRLTLRAWAPGDGPRFQEAAQSSYAHLRTFMPWAKPSFTPEEAEAFARRSRGEYLLGTNFNIAITDPDERFILGGCGFHLREGDLSLRQAEAGMWIRASHAGRGLGTHALVALLRWAFSEWPWQRVSWRCASENAPSQRVAARAGLTLEGVLQSHRLNPDGSRGDTLCFAALRDAWRPPDPR